MEEKELILKMKKNIKELKEMIKIQLIKIMKNWIKLKLYDLQ